MKTIHLLFTLPIVMAHGAAFANSGALSGKYILDTTDCVQFLNYEQGDEIPRGFEAGAVVEVYAGDKALTLTPAGTVTSIDSVTYAIGTFDESGPASDGQSSLTNRYLNGGTAFSHAQDNLNPGDNFGSGIVITRVTAGLKINFEDGQATCELKDAR